MFHCLRKTRIVECKARRGGVSPYTDQPGSRCERHNHLQHVPLRQHHRHHAPTFVCYRSAWSKQRLVTLIPVAHPDHRAHASSNVFLTEKDKVIRHRIGLTPNYSTPAPRGEPSGGFTEI
ncbi:hypothetical protein E2C01_054496 [Portunus trituberculatus]|uniref:Uncharacterized protein n=1 Tax=Portunus trituberculatus TaxID=210409 RepID=A0A5B7GK01_PORTR|nr:hypothetical protein [Portunus trituberculatus]